MERDPGEQRRNDLAVERDRADDCHREQWEPHLADAHRVAEAVTNLATPSWDDDRRTELAPPDHQQGDDHSRERRRVDVQADRCPQHREQHAGDRRSHDAGARHRRPVQPDRARNVFGLHELGDEALASRRLEGRRTPEQQGRDCEHRQRAIAVGHEQRRCQRDHRRRDIGDDEDPTLVDPVGHGSRVRAEEQQREELQRDHEAESRRVVRLPEHDPADRGGLRPRTDHGEDLPHEEEAVVPDAQGPERPGRGVLPMGSLTPASRRPLSTIVLQMRAPAPS